MKALAPLSVHSPSARIARVLVAPASEPEAGSDAGATRTRAILADGEWTLNGAKAFITNSGTSITSVVTVTARTGDGEISAILVPSGTPGFLVEPAYDKLGWHISDTHGLS